MHIFVYRTKMTTVVADTKYHRSKGVFMDQVMQNISSLQKTCRRIIKKNGNKLLSDLNSKLQRHNSKHYSVLLFQFNFLLKDGDDCEEWINARRMKDRTLTHDSLCGGD